ncbi:MAG TPA: hypothetical protein VEX35_06935 [Allosphingosinicella sp.]|nr:hypothetical protein [Allosphingosinicella sp.]
MIKLLAATAMLSGQAATPAPAPTQCLTRQQIGDLTVVVYSVMLDGMREACRPHLAASAFMVQPAGTDYASRLRSEAQRRSASAAQAIARAFGTGEMPPEVVGTLLEGMMAPGAAAEAIGPGDPGLCREMNEVVEAMAPMSPDQLGRMTAGFISLAQQMEGRFPPPEETAGEAGSAASPDQDEGEAAVAAADAQPPRAPATRILCAE